MEGFRDDGGLFGVSGHRQAANLAYLGLHALQHRGEGTASLVVSDGHMLRQLRGTGTVQEAFDGPHLGELRGQTAVGQVGGGVVFGRYGLGQAAVALSGRFSNGARLRQELKRDGAVLQTGSDAELLLQLMASSGQRTVVNRLVDALWKVDGAFSVLVCTEDRLIAVRDPRGFRPMVLGRHEGAAMVASEDVALSLVGAEMVRPVAPGEMLIIDGANVRSVKPFGRREPSACIHEFTGLARTDATVFGQSVFPLQVAFGERLAKEQPCPQAEVVVGIPDDGVAAAIGFAKASGKPYREGLLRAPWSARRFVEPPSGLVDFGTRLRWRPVPAVVEGKRVALVAGSLVTGLAMSRAVRMLRRAGANEVHVRVAAPPVQLGCAYGVRSPTPEELAASRHPSLVDLAGHLLADTLGYLSLDSLHQLVGERTDGSRPFCDSCFSGQHVLPPEEPDDQLGLFEPDAD